MLYKHLRPSCTPPHTHTPGAWPCVFQFLQKAHRVLDNVLADWGHRSRNISVTAPLGHGPVCAHRQCRRARALAPHSLPQVSPACRPPSSGIARGNHPWPAGTRRHTRGSSRESWGEGGEAGIWGQQRAPWRGLRASNTVRDPNWLRSRAEDLHYAKALGQLTSTK